LLECFGLVDRIAQKAIGDAVASVVGKTEFV
jgi:hypothetical protein